MRRHRLFYLFTIVLALGASANASAQTVPTYLPADNNPADGIVSEVEFTAYCDAWRKGLDWPEHGGPVPVDFVTRTAWIFWEYDGYYEVDVEGDPGNSGTYSGSVTLTSDSLQGLLPIGPTLIATEVYWRSARIYFSVNAPVNTYACAVEMAVPAGWNRLFDDERVSTVNDLDAMPNGTVGAEGRIVRWGPYRTGDIPDYLGFGVIAMDGTILPDVSGLEATVSFDGSLETVTDFQAEKPWLSIIIGTDSAGEDPGLRLDGPLLERALAGRANRPSDEFAPVFERFSDESGTSWMRCTVVRDVIYPEMAFIVQRTTDFSQWQAVEVEWLLKAQDGRYLTFETEFPCVGGPEVYRVQVEENSVDVAGLVRGFVDNSSLTLDDWVLGGGFEFGGSLDWTYYFNGDGSLTLMSVGAYDPTLSDPLYEAYFPNDGNGLWDYEVVVINASRSSGAFLELLDEHQAVIYNQFLATEAAQYAQAYGLELYTLSDGNLLLMTSGELANAPSSLRGLIVEG
ncbi:hypothetical protein H5P28_10830 [Ruficoccus amylovorans]|uniref:Uncharacterized protein n=1 Tax=Ruficoccus amylovorans TaxID=1804625 RepID=A0A842HDX1_9BACT|nr:hypothetical protein [Ruficoccus amylovorans]MBC2594755.1 hypothetical protein [Ruficoccus amylovorans]